MSSTRSAILGLAAATALATAGALFATVARPSAVSLPVLGDETSCQAYAGLPPDWRKDPHAGMVRLSGGEFTFGSERGYPDERPAGHAPVRVPGFWIDQTEVTIAQFKTFVAVTGYVTEAEREGGAVVFRQPTQAQMDERAYAWWTYVKGADWKHPGGPGSGIAGLDHYPVTFVTRADALAYAKWLGRDLPTEAEWEYAAKAGQSGPELDAAPHDAQGKPTANYWQGAFPAVDLAQDGHAGLAPVGCYAANAWGLHDTIGNVWEWTSDAYAGPHQAHLNGDTAAVAAPYHRHDQPYVIKGGSFLCSPDFCVRYRASAREQQEADLATAHIGFRTVRRDS